MKNTLMVDQNQALCVNSILETQPSLGQKSIGMLVWL